MATLKEIVKWIQDGKVHRFYTCSEWLKVKAEVLEDDKRECQICKNKYKRYRRATLVHHHRHVKQHPELCLSKYYIDIQGSEQRNLISVCKECHEVECHPERMRKYKRKSLLTKEMW